MLEMQPLVDTVTKLFNVLRQRRVLNTYIFAVQCNNTTEFRLVTIEPVNDKYRLTVSPQIPSIMLHSIIPDSQLPHSTLTVTLPFLFITTQHLAIYTVSKPEELTTIRELKDCLKT